MKGRDTIPVLREIAPIFAVLFIQPLLTKQRLLALVTFCCPLRFGKIMGNKIKLPVSTLGPQPGTVTAAGNGIPV